MYEPSEKPKFERGNSIHSLRRTLSQMSSKSSVEDPDASPEFKVRLIQIEVCRVITMIIGDLDHIRNNPKIFIPSQGYKYIGDPVDVIKYNVAKYQGSERGTHFCDIDLSRDEVRQQLYIPPFIMFVISKFQKDH